MPRNRASYSSDLQPKNGRCTCGSTNAGTSKPLSGEPCCGGHGRSADDPAKTILPSSQAIPASGTTVAAAAAPRTGAGPEAVARAAAAAAPRFVMPAETIGGAPRDRSRGSQAARRVAQVVHLLVRGRFPVRWPFDGPYWGQRGSPTDGL